MNAGKLKHRCEFFKPREGAPVGTFDPITDPNPQFWAGFRTLRGEALYEARRVWNKVTAEVITRYFTIDVYDSQWGYWVKYAPVAGWKITFYHHDGTTQDYYIESVVDTDEKHEEYVMTVSEVTT